MRAWSSIREILRSVTALVIGILLAGSLMYGLARLIRTEGGATLGKVAQLHKAPGASKPQKSNHAKVTFMPRVASLQKPEPKPQLPKPTEIPSGQVVETARPSTQEVPLNARYLGRYDMKVDREQKSMGHKSPGRDLGKMHIENPSPLESPESTSKDPTQIPQQRQKHVKSSSGAPDRAVEAAQPTENAGPAPLAKPGHEAPQGSLLTQSKSDGLLLPSTSAGNVVHNIQALSGNPGSNDYLPDVDNEGETNLLNTRAFRYWGFYQDLKERVARVWDPVQVMRSRDPTGNRYGVRDRLTTLHVVLDGEGAVKRIAVAKHSGLEFLDDEAQRAFTAAGPFPNPPAGLRNQNGEIDIQFGFLLELSSNRFKFFRMPQ